ARDTRPDRVVINLPKGWTTTRLFQFPTRDRKTIQNSLSFELDDDVPFAMDNIIYDFAILGGSANDGPVSNVFAAVAVKSDIAAIVSEFEAMGLSPDVITIESWSISHILRRVLPKEYEGKPVCVVNIGNKQTSVHM